MTLSAGTRLQNYEILESIGAGGMGEVYRARDTKLGRDVAIKVLPEAFSQDKVRIARLEREARLLASLNHPNIATLFEFEETDGTHYLALEFVEGENLAEQIKRGALSLDRALPLFKQIAEALEAAHEKGIIHRDLKPANIKVTPEGKIKVLDFGLAKALTGESPARDQSESPTITRDGTVTGVLLGTAPYMSPEQARGKAVDKRTDIWAFGCVLFESLSGKKAFEGETVTDTIASIVKVEPEWNELPASTPPRIRDLLTRCLRKDPTQRLREIGSARLDVEDAMAEISGGVSVVPVPARKPLWRRALPLLITALVVGLTVWALMRSETTSPAQVTRFTVHLPTTDVLYLAPSTPSIDISPDGSQLIYNGGPNGRAQGFLRPMGSLEATPIRGPEEGTWRHIFFSPDGQWIGFFDAFDDWKLKKVSRNGGPPIFLCDAGMSGGAAWGPDDTIVFFPQAKPELWSVKATGGAPHSVSQISSESKGAIYKWPHFLPDGKTILATESLSVSGDHRVVAVTLETGEVRALVEGGSYGRYASSGHLVFARSGSLVAAPFDLDDLKVLGSPVPVLDEVRVDPSSGVADYAFSRDGSLVYVTHEQVPPSTLVSLDRDGTSRVLSDGRRFGSPRFSTDGNRVLVTIQDELGQLSYWIYDLIRDTLTLITSEEGQNTAAIWTPDDARITFGAHLHEDGRTELHSKAADGSGQAEKLTSIEIAWAWPTSWSPDGNTLAVTHLQPDGNLDISLLILDGTPSVVPFTQTHYWEMHAMFSSDGRWLSYTSDESGRSEVYVRPYPGPGEKVQISTNGGGSPVWSRDGRELFYMDGNRMMAVPIEPGSTLVAGQPIQISEGDYENQACCINYDVSPDAASLVMVKREPSREIHVVLNWFEELKRLVPKN